MGVEGHFWSSAPGDDPAVFNFDQNRGHEPPSKLVTWKGLPPDKSTETGWGRGERGAEAPLITLATGTGKFRSHRLLIHVANGGLG